jgi:BRCT domain type II-containing protein
VFENVTFVVSQLETLARMARTPKLPEKGKAAPSKLNIHPSHHSSHSSKSSSKSSDSSSSSDNNEFETEVLFVVTFALTIIERVTF